MTSKTQPGYLLPVTSPKLESESLPGYVHRLCEMNGLAKAEWLHIEPELRAQGTFVHLVAMDADALTSLEHLACSTSGSLVHKKWHARDSAAGMYVGVWGEMLPADALMLSEAQVCPACLNDDSPYLHADWDFSIVTVCARHRQQLIGECPSCGNVLRWNRPRMAVCGHCAADLRRVKTPSCTSSDITVADFAAAVAGFIFVGKVESLEPPESLFELVRLLSLSRREFLTQRHQRHFSRLPVAHRFEACHRLAGCIVNRKVVGGLVHHLLLEHVSHICMLLGEARARSRLFRLLASNDFLSVPLRSYLAYTTHDAEPMRAAELFEGRPPRLFTQHQAIEFVGCTKEEFEMAVAERRVEPPSKGLAFDLDQLLDMRRRLRSLLSEDEVDHSFRVPGLCRGMLFYRILKSERRVGLPIAVSVENYEWVLDRLVEIAESPHSSITATVRIGDVLDEVDANLLASLISLVLGGGATTFDWEPPWGWRQMVVDEGTWYRIRGQ